MNYIKNIHEKTNIILIYTFFLAVMIFTIMNKQNLFRDEVYSYTLSNNINSIIVDFEEGQVYASPEQLFLDSIAVNASERFNISNVWLNQKNDVHPPLYYLILHIICSLFAGRFSVWYAGSINIFFAIMTLYVFRRLVCQFVNDEALVNLCSILFVVSIGVLQCVSLFRMYVMAMFWVTLTTYLFVRSFNGENSWKSWLQIGAVAAAGALTHYYCIIYLCAICLVFGICLIVEKRWKDILILIGSMLLAALASITIFPAMLTHMFSGYRGTESLDNLIKATNAEHWERIKSFYNFVNEQALGKIGGGGTVFVILFLVTVVVFMKNQSEIQIHLNQHQVMQWFIFGIPPIIYFLLVSMSAAYVTDRYIFPIYATALGVFLCIMIRVWKKAAAAKHACIVICLMAAVIISNEWHNVQWNYLYKSEAGFLASLDDYNNMNCVYIYDANFRVVGGFFELKHYGDTVFLSQEHVENIKEYSDLVGDEFMLTVRGNDNNVINSVKNLYPYLNHFDVIGGHDGSTTYHAYAGDEIIRTCIYSYDKKSTLGADKLEACQNILLSQSGTPFWLIQVNNQYEFITANRQALDISNNIYADGTNIQLFTLNHSDAQKWKMVNNADGSCSFLAKDERFALTCGSDGNVYLAEYHPGETTQCWWID